MTEKIVKMIALILFIFPIYVFAEDNIATSSLTCTNASANDYNCSLNIKSNNDKKLTSVSVDFGNLEINNLNNAGVVSQNIHSYTDIDNQNFSLTFSINTDKDKVSIGKISACTEDITECPVIANETSATLEKIVEPTPEEPKEPISKEDKPVVTDKEVSNEKAPSTKATNTKKVKNPKTFRNNIAYIGLGIVLVGAAGLVILNKKKLMM